MNDEGDRIVRRWIRFKRERWWGRYAVGHFDFMKGYRIPFPVGPEGETAQPYTGLVLQVEETEQWISIEFTAIERERVEEDDDEQA